MNGTIIETTKKAIIVATGSNDAIALTDIQVAGKKRMLAANYLRRYKLRLLGKYYHDNDTNVRLLAFETIKIL